MKNILFVLRTYNDIDHIVPLIYKATKEGSYAYIIFTNKYDYKNDYRLQFLQKNFPNNIRIIFFSIYYKFTGSTNIFIRIIRRLIINKNRIKRIMKKYKINASVFEWGGTYAKDLRGFIFSASKELGIPTFCIPHGCNIYLNYDITNKIRKNKYENNIWPDFSKRNAFDYYVVQSVYHKKMIVKWGQNPKKSHAWGSLRFFPEWSKINKKICPQFFCHKKCGDNMIKIVIMLPHWEYNVYKDECLLLIKCLSKIKWIYLVIKDHTRGTGALPNSLRTVYKDKENVEFGLNGHSPALVAWADIIINFGSSIGLEALLQQKYLINPVYLHSNNTIFEKTGACYIANTQKDVLDIIIKVRNKTLSPINKKNITNIYKEIIYGGNENEYDVLSFYYKNICKGRK